MKVNMDKMYISHLLLSSQQSPIYIVNYFISKS